MTDIHSTHSVSKLLAAVDPASWQALLGLIPDPLLVLDQAHVVVYCNPAFERVFLWDSHHIVNRRLDFVPPDKMQEWNDCVERLSGNEGINGLHTRRLTSPGQSLDVTINAALLFDGRGQPAGMVMTLKDITRQNIRERNRKILLRMTGVQNPSGQWDELLAAVADAAEFPIDEGRIGAALEKSKERVAQLYKTKDQIVHHLSHELKTPLAVLSASIRLLERGIASGEDPKWRRIHERITRNLDRLLQLEYKLEDILRASDCVGTGLTETVALDAENSGDGSME